MEVKEYLKQTDGIKHHIDLLRIESQQLKLQSQSVQGVQYGDLNNSYILFECSQIA